MFNSTVERCKTDEIEKCYSVKKLNKETKQENQ